MDNPLALLLRDQAQPEELTLYTQTLAFVRRSDTVAVKSKVHVYSLM